jgi:rubrerythrin
VQHAFGYMDLLYLREALDPVKCLDLAIAGETYEYTEMYPRFRHLAEQEGNQAAVREFGEQIAESREHADSFQALLVKAATRCAALTKVEERHARRYQEALQRARA